MLALCRMAEPEIILRDCSFINGVLPTSWAPPQLVQSSWSSSRRRRRRSAIAIVATAAMAAAVIERICRYSVIFG